MVRVFASYDFWFWFWFWVVPARTTADCPRRPVELHIMIMIICEFSNPAPAATYRVKASVTPVLTLLATSSYMRMRKTRVIFVALPDNGIASFRVRLLNIAIYFLFLFHLSAGRS